MKTLFNLLIFLMPISLTAQWSYQLGLGRVLGSDRAFVEVLLSDTLSYSFLKKANNTTSTAIMTTYSLNEGFLFRTGIDVSVTTIDVRVVNTQLISGMDIYDERRTISDFHIPVEIQYAVTKDIFLNGGLSTNVRVEFGRNSIKEEVSDGQLFGNPIVVDEFEKVAYNSIRKVSLNYRIGTTVKFIRWLGVDFMYDRPFGSLVKPLKYEGDEAKAKFKYGTMTLRLTYFFEWKKLKATLSK